MCIGSAALKSHTSNKYYINGNWVIDLPQEYDVADTTVTYKRPYRKQNDKEAFIAKGPTSEDLDVMVGNNTVEFNLTAIFYFKVLVLVKTVEKINR